MIGKAQTMKRDKSKLIFDKGKKYRSKKSSRTIIYCLCRILVLDKLTAVFLTVPYFIGSWYIVLFRTLSGSWEASQSLSCDYLGTFLVPAVHFGGEVVFLWMSGVLGVQNEWVSTPLNSSHQWYDNT